MQVIKFSKVVLLLTIVLFMATDVLAAIVMKQGVGQIKYSGWGNPSTSVKQEAIEKAKINALKKFTGTFTVSETKNYEKIRTSVESDIDRYIIDYKVIDDDTDKDTKLYRIAIEASINKSLIEIELQKVSAVQQAPSDERSYMGFVFVARKVKSRKVFDVRRTKRAVEETTIEESEESSAGAEEIHFAGESIKDTVKKTGGSSVQRSDELEYDVSNASDINKTMINIFSTAGYEVVEAVYLEDYTDGLVNVSDFIEDFRFGDDISGKTRRSAVKGCKDAGIAFFAIGTLDIGAKDVDPVSGLIRVYVSVNGNILDLRSRFPKTIASVGPVQYAGLGLDQAVASRNALTLAGKNAAKDLTAQLNAKKVK